MHRTAQKNQNLFKLGKNLDDLFDEWTDIEYFMVGNISAR